jgi:hypothetical protein
VLSQQLYIIIIIINNKFIIYVPSQHLQANYRRSTVLIQLHYGHTKYVYNNNNNNNSNKYRTPETKSFETSVKVYGTESAVSESINVGGVQG